MSLLIWFLWVLLPGFVFVFVFYTIRIMHGYLAASMVLLQDIEFMDRKIEDLEKVLKRSNAKEHKIEMECCQKVSLQESRIVMIVVDDSFISGI